MHKSEIKYTKNLITRYYTRFFEKRRCTIYKIFLRTPEKVKREKDIKIKYDSLRSEIYAWFLNDDTRTSKVVVSVMPPPLFIVAAANDLTCLVGCWSVSR